MNLSVKLTPASRSSRMLGMGFYRHAVCSRLFDSETLSNSWAFVWVAVVISAAIWLWRNLGRTVVPRCLSISNRLFVVGSRMAGLETLAFERRGRAADAALVLFALLPSAQLPGVLRALICATQMKSILN